LCDAQRDDRECSARETDCNKADRDRDGENDKLGNQQRSNEVGGNLACEVARRVASEAEARGMAKVSIPV